MAEKIRITYVGFPNDASLPSAEEIAGFGISKDCFVFPGFCDVHVHLREPGFSYKETIATGTAAAAAGGYTDVCAMPNLDPVPDTRERLKPELDRIAADACIRVHPYAAITRGEKGEELSDMAALAADAVAFSDDGKGVQSDERMEEAMRTAKGLGKLIAAHCEVNELLRGGYIHDGAYCRAHGHRGICSESEWQQIRRDLELVKRTGCRYHVCHISCKESVELLRRAKAEGLDVSCETAPHYLTMDDSLLREDGRFKMNPPLRDAADRQALLEGLKDGTIDVIATDHAPHAAEEKEKGLEKSAFGIPGLETAFPVLYTRLVKTGELELEELIRLLTESPRKRFGIPWDGSYTVWDLESERTVRGADFLSKAKLTPFEGWSVFGTCMLTVCGGKAAYRFEKEK